MKKRVRLTESDLHRVVRESVKNVLKESAYRNVFIQQQISNLDKYKKSETVLRAVSYRILKTAIMLLDKQYQLDCEQLNELVNFSGDADWVKDYEVICIDVINKAGGEPFKYASGRVKNLISSYCTYCQENPDQEIRFYEWYRGYAHDNAVKNGHLYNSNLVSETDLHKIIKESVKNILNEVDYTDAQFAHLAGQADTATHSGRAALDPKFKARKERQKQLFANQAIGRNYEYRGSSSKEGGYNNLGRTTANLPNNNITYSDGGTADYIGNNFNPDNKETPFEMQRTNYHSTGGFNGKRTNLPNNGKVYTSAELRDMDAQNNTDTSDVRYGNSALNRAYKQGQQAKKRGTYKTVGGETYQNGTGTKSGAFKRLGK